METRENYTPPGGANLIITIPDGSFDGPFHLLWQMIKDHELDIFDLPLTFVADTYLRYIEEMQKLDVNIASEFLVMAAELLKLKSQLLLPVEERGEQEGEGEEASDPREELVKRLLIYQKYKSGAEKIGDLPLLGYNTFTRPFDAIARDVDINAESALQEIDGFALVGILYKAIEDKKEKISLEYFTERISIADKISALVDYFCDNEMGEFYTLIRSQGRREEIIATFLAVLEMVRLKMLKIHQAKEGGEIYLSLVSRENLLNPAYRENGYDYR
ncbi:MAG: segregation/condensation protein A [Myxococcota bacterium]